MGYGGSAVETVGVDLKTLFGGAYCGKRVLVTGHTGFKGSWLALWLKLMGADVMGYALDPVHERDNFVLCGLQDDMTDLRGDIRDKAALQAAFARFEPHMVFHLAAQPIVRLSYAIPADTLETNIMGTVNVLENIRLCESVRSAVIVTSDKCYENKEQIWGYRERDAMGGFDPYSASKGCAELVAAAYTRSFFASGHKGVATARAGNVIGGGDWAEDRIVPDCMRALLYGRAIGVRNPGAVRPWQFVLEPLYGYLLLGVKLLNEPEKYSGAWNFGPDSAAPVGELVALLTDIWGGGVWEDISSRQAVHEAAQLNLDCTKAKTQLGWRPRLTLYQALSETAAWYKACAASDMRALCARQIEEYSARCCRDERPGYGGGEGN